MLENCRQIAGTALSYDSFISEEKSRNRIEIREARVYDQLTFTDQAWNDFQALVRVHRITEIFHTKKKKWERREEVSYYLSTCKKTAKEFAELIRKHWGVENQNHYVRDVALQEDDSKIRKKPGIMAILRSFTLNILRKNQVENIQKELYENTLDFDRILKYYGVRKN